MIFKTPLKNRTEKEANGPANPVPVLTSPIMELGNALRYPKITASPKLYEMPTRTLAATATQNIGGLSSLKQAKATKVNEIRVIHVTSIILLICLTLTKHAPWTYLLIIPKSIMKNRKNPMKLP